MQNDEITDLHTLNQIAATLNQSVDVRSTLESALTQLIQLMELQTGWVFLADQTAQDRWGGRGFVLATHYGLPPALALNAPNAWGKGCDCQTLCQKGQLKNAYNEVRCSRLADADGDKQTLSVHASAPLVSHERLLGILNVAAPNWDAFSPRSLALLTNVGSLIGIALERARLYDLLQDRRIHEQAALLDFSNQLLSRRDLEDLINYLVTTLRELLDVDACALLLPGEDPNYLDFVAHSGWRSEPVKNKYRVPADKRSGSGRAMRSQRPLLTNEEGETQFETLWLADWMDVEQFQGAAIVPLVVENRSIGALAIDSRSPHQFDRSEIRLLQLMANQAAIAIDRTRLRREEIERHRLEEELAVGRQIQLSMLPSRFPDVPGWEIAYVYQPAKQVGGDFYDFFQLPADKTQLGMVIADVSDKGVPAALFMALCRSIIRNNAMRGHPPALTLTRANQFIQEDSQSDMFLSIFYGVLDTENGRLTYANAGHNYPLQWHHDTQTLVPVQSKGTILGVFDDVNIHEHVGQIQPEDVLIFYTDGVTEAVNQAYEEFGEDRLQAIVTDLLINNSHTDSETIAATILQAVGQFTTGMTQFDDLTLLIIRRL
ncbi:MAG: SpoIIE family protein phosphatase [Chloroflexi bacterium]|nr:SpoIIE family protein phosphatase [Chloroflexota bacterium]